MHGENADRVGNTTQLEFRGWCGELQLQLGFALLVFHTRALDEQGSQIYRSSEGEEIDTPCYEKGTPSPPSKWICQEAHTGVHLHQDRWNVHPQRQGTLHTHMHTHTHTHTHTCKKQNKTNYTHTQSKAQKIHQRTHKIPSTNTNTYDRLRLRCAWAIYHQETAVVSHPDQQSPQNPNRAS
jgi:hypothetical protein